MYEREEAGRFDKVSKALSGLGAAVMGLAGHRQRSTAALGGGALILVWAALERWSILKACFQSARDQRYTVIPQRLSSRCGAGESG